MQSRLFSYPDTHRHRLGPNYNQLPVNVPVVPVANFQRDGLMAFNNQSNRPNYQSTISPLTYLQRKFDLTGHPAGSHDRIAKHEAWVTGAFLDLSEITERKSSNPSWHHVPIYRVATVDFEQPRALYQTVMNDTDRAHLVSNVAGHLGGVKSPEIKLRTCECL